MHSNRGRRGGPSGKFTVVIAIGVAPGNFARRAALRATWLEWITEADDAMHLFFTEKPTPGTRQHRDGIEVTAGSRRACVHACMRSCPQRARTKDTKRVARLRTKPSPMGARKGRGHRLSVRARGLLVCSSVLGNARSLTNVG